ncbi:MAG TPA: sugar phosphate isomerase/epimerase [Gaiellaceae bacterium]|nr:sugar phosphate isomerase/epimerase [Gaiellaceae bacterium]
MSQVGLMLYTVREDCARDFEGTVRAVGALGFDGVEVFDLHGRPAGEVRGWLDELGLEAIGRHALLEAIESSLPELAEEARVLGWRRISVAWIDPAKLGDPELPARLGRAAAAAAEHGLELGYHNHDAELRQLDSGELFLDLVPEELFLELDLGWVWFAGVDPVGLLASVGSRCPLAHVKDFSSRDRSAFCPVGDGVVGYDRALPAAVRAGVEWLIVEQDETDGDALEAARRSKDAVDAILQVAA